MYESGEYKTGKSLPFVRLDDYGYQLLLTYSTSSKAYAGVHELMLYVYLEDYISILNQSPEIEKTSTLKSDTARIVVTLYRVINSLQVDEVEYVLSTGEHEV